ALPILAVKRGIQKIYHEADIMTFAMADGGEGTTETLVDGMKGDLIETTVLGPLRKEVIASYGYIKSDELAIIEVASACGLTLLRSEEHTSELQSRFDLVCSLLLEKKKIE